MNWFASRGAIALLVLLVLAGCGGTTAAPTSPSASVSTSATAAPLRYAALGDSYTAAPYVYLTDVAGGCLRSNHNYPSLLAKRLDAALTDVSCSGADTTNIDGGQKTFDGVLPSQISAVTADTRLVTLGMGGNDFGLFGSLANGCPITGPNGQTFGLQSGTQCGHVNTSAAASDVRQIGERLQAALRAIKGAAPRAKVVLVGYPRIASTGTQCAAQLPITQADAVAIDKVTRALSDAMAAAATAAGASYVDMYAASQGHDVCAGNQAWVNGIHTDTQRAAPLHPFLAEQQAVADRVAAIASR